MERDACARFSAVEYTDQEHAVWRSAQRGDLDELQRRVLGYQEAGADPDKRKRALNLALKVAVWNEQVAAVALLLDSNANPNDPQVFGFPWSLNALTKTHADGRTIQLLVLHGAFLNRGSLYMAQTSAAVVALTKAKADADGTCYSARPLLRHCSEDPVHVDVVRTLLACKANVNGADNPFGSTALHSVCRRPQARSICALVHLLLRAKANPCAETSGRETARMLLARAEFAARARSGGRGGRITAALRLLSAAEHAHKAHYGD